MVSGRKAGKLLRSDPCKSFHQINDISRVGPIQSFPSVFCCLSVCLSNISAVFKRNDKSPSSCFSAHRQLVSYSPKTPRIPIVKFETIVDKKKAA